MLPILPKDPRMTHYDARVLHATWALRGPHICMTKPNGIQKSTPSEKHIVTLHTTVAATPSTWSHEQRQSQETETVDGRWLTILNRATRTNFSKQHFTQLQRKKSHLSPFHHLSTGWNTNTLASSKEVTPKRAMCIPHPHRPTSQSTAKIHTMRLLTRINSGDHYQRAKSK